MRPIKFRAWDKVTKQLSKPLTIGDIQTAEVANWFPHLGWQFNNLTWLQFTGLLDKNGKEIYEGDIVVNWWSSFFDEKKRVDEGRGFVEMKNGCFGYKSKYGFWYILHNKLEIIGNIYKNPELLESTHPQSGG